MIPWLYSIEPELDGDANMRRDEAMAEACRIDSRPRLRLYSWRPWTLSLGHHQDDASIDRVGLERAGYGIVRRPTGGRAVFHAEELTYAVAMPASGDSVHDTYARISEALRRGLAHVGADVTFARSQPDFREHYAVDDSASCFSASALNELVWNGRKLVGSAQRRYAHVLLQHGSLLVGSAHLSIVDFLFPGADELQRDRMKRRLASRTATLFDILGADTPAFYELATAIVRGFAETFDASMLLESDLTRPLSSTTEPALS